MNRLVVSLAVVVGLFIPLHPEVASAKGKPLPGGAAVSPVSARNCSALLPKGWSLTSDDRSQAADGYSPNRRNWVGYGMWGVNSAMQPYWQVYGVDPDFYSPVPELQAMATLRMVAKDLKYDTTFTTVGPAVSQGMYKAVKVMSRNAVGIMVWADQPYPGDGVSFTYIAAFRATLAPKGTSDNELLRQMRNALSIQCTTQLRASPEPFSPSSSIKKPKKAGRSDQYNSQLDSFWAHDPATGQTYSLTNSDLVTTGCGTGNTVAVKVVGNSCIELVPGRSD